MAETRQLVALMLTDMVGYTRLAQSDEARALRLVEEHAAAIRESVKAHGGRSVKSTGDGFLVEFPSALQAVSCALDVQRRFHDRNRAAQPEDQFAVRIGLHVGDVVRRGEDVYGDGVNITSRIEPLAAPGGICVTAALRDQVWNKIPQPLVSLGRQELKNLQAPIEVFRIVLPWESNEAARAEEARPLDRTRLAVLPLSNVSPDPGDAYFTDGMTEELIYTLSKVPGLKVIAQTSAMIYKGTAKPIREIGRELSVGAVLEGSVRKAGERLRITVQLIDAASEEHLWAGRFDRELADVFEIQTEIAQNVAGELKGVLAPGSSQRPTGNLDAYKEYLKGRQFWARRSKASLYKALEHFEAAVGADPAFAKAYSGLADTYTVLANHGYEPAAQALPRAQRAAEKATQLDPSLGEAFASLGIVRLLFQHDAPGAERELERAIELNPNYATAHQWLGLVYDYSGRGQEAHAAMERALELDPLAHITHVSFAGMLMESGDPERAKALLLRARDLDPDYPGLGMSLAYTEMILWNWHGAEDALSIALHRNPNNVAALTTKMLLGLLRGDVAVARAAIEKAERIEPESPHVWASRGAFEQGTGNLEEGIRWTERVVEARSDELHTVLELALRYVALGRAEQAARCLARLDEQPPISRKLQPILLAARGSLAALEGREHDVAEALEALRRASWSPRRHTSAALVLCAAGKLDEAFDEVERAMSLHDPGLIGFLLDPLIASMRTHPRFQRVLEVMGLGAGVAAAR
ncbi:MAG: adenylate/guanylate cyclase domain-containing protein [Candidatus Bipolaricaulota bacterium]